MIKRDNIRIENPRVGGSIPPLATNTINKLRLIFQFPKIPLREIFGTDLSGDLINLVGPQNSPQQIVIFCQRYVSDRALEHNPFQRVSWLCAKLMHSFVL